MQRSWNSRTFCLGCITRPRDHRIGFIGHRFQSACPEVPRHYSRISNCGISGRKEGRLGQSDDFHSYAAYVSFAFLRLRSWGMRPSLTIVEPKGRPCQHNDTGRSLHGTSITCSLLPKVRWRGHANGTCGSSNDDVLSSPKTIGYELFSNHAPGTRHAAGTRAGSSIQIRSSPTPDPS